MTTQALDAEARKVVDTIYADEEDRYVVSLIVGYKDVELDSDENPEWAEMDSEARARVAALWALRLTRDDGSPDTQWQVWDRETGEIHWFEQGEFDEDEEFSGF